MSTRKYDSPLRQQRAARTRQRIVDAAGELFETKGFESTTIAEIAAAADVAAPTVYSAFGSKGGLLEALLTRMEQQADADEWLRRVEAAPSPRERLSRFAAWSAAFFGDNRALLRVARGARTVPEVAALWRRGEEHRRAGVDQVAARLADDDALLADLDESAAADRIWMLTGPEVYLLAIDGNDWSDADYVDWLASTLACQVLRPDA